MISYTRTQNIFLTIRVILRVFLHGKPVKVYPTGPRSVVILFLTKNIGDIIFATPVFRAIKEKYPETKITVIGSHKNKIILDGNPDVDEYIICPDSIKDLINFIKSTDAEFGFSLSPSTVDIASLIIAGVPSVATFVIKNAIGGTVTHSFLSNFCMTTPFFIGSYYAQEYLRILEHISIKSFDTKKRLYFSEQARRKVKLFLEKENFNIHVDKMVIFSPGAGTKIKQWPAERFAEVADHVHGKYHMKIAVIGGQGDQDEIKRFIKSLKKTNAVMFVDSDLDELKSFISHGYILIANDSGPVYIAEAFNIPTVVIVGPTDENEHPPKGKFNKVVKYENRGRPEMKGHLGAYNMERARCQIEKVSLDLVVKEVDNLIYTLENK